MTALLQFWGKQTGMKKVLFGSSVVAVVLGALFVLGAIATPQQVEIRADGEVIAVRTWQKTVAGVLDEAGVSTGEADEVVPALGEPVAANQVIRVIRAIPVEIVAGDQRVAVSTVPRPVAEVLELAGITLGDDDIISMELSDYVAPEQNLIEIVRVTYENIVKEVKIPFTTEIIDDKNAVQGIRRTVQAGKDGKVQEEYQITYHNGVEAARTLVAKKVISQPVKRVVAQGVQPKVMVASRGSQDIRYRQLMNMEATAYTHTGNATFTGIMPYVGIVAVDPKVIPLGTQLYVDGYGFAKAADIGSAIKGNKIDLFMDTREQALKFGRRMVKVYILE
jgi:uncharacterized protein YabE (DUF348 family)